MMKLEIRLYATLRRHQPQAPAGLLSLEVAAGSAARDLLPALGIKPEEVHMLMINGVSASLDAALADGDRVGIFPAVGGG